ncbi:hypothetical protein EJB05_40350, partial [Eragrostis curvula]
MGGRIRYRRNRGSQTATSVKAVESANGRSRRNRPSRQSRTSQASQGGGRNAKEKSAERASARAAGAEACGGSAGWNPAPPSERQQKTPNGGGAWRARKRRRKRGEEATRWKEAQEAEARARSSGDGTRRRISASTSSASAARSGIGGGGGSGGWRSGCFMGSNKQREMEAGIAVSVSTMVMKPPPLQALQALGERVEESQREVAFLNDELTTMKAFLEKMEDADELNPLAKDWRNRVREMAYDREDCIDDFMSCVAAGDANVKDGILRKAVRCLRKSRAHHQIASRIQEIKIRMQEASERRTRYIHDDCIPSSSNGVVVDPRLIALYTESTNLVGIDGPKKELIKWIMDDKQQLKVVSIVGFGGLGKTTLANQVYHQTKEEFDCKAFVSVSQRLDVIGLLDSISSQLRRQESSCGRNVQGLVNKIREYLESKRYFIVIDDLWDSTHWDVIRCVFPENSLRSRVIVTTRSRSMGIACCYPNECIFYMKPLSHQDSRRLFLTRIFGSEDGCPSNYEEVSDEILKRCGGLPLAIITIASLLAVQKMRLNEGWEYIRNCLSSQSVTNPSLEGMKHILNLSYRNLPHHLRACFLYITMYPEDHKIDRDNLVKQWVAEGFVSNFRGPEAMDVADNYFIDLVNRSLIQPVSIGFNNRVLSCRVHDMMLDLIISKCTGDNFVCLDTSPPETTGLHKYKVRRRSVISSGGEDCTMLPVGLTSLSNVRSLTVFTGLKYRNISKESVQVTPLSDFKFLRVLFLQLLPHYGTPDMKIADLTGISKLLHLRYLSVVSKSRSKNLVRLPGKIRSLRQLETLEAHGVLVESIPNDLVHLQHLSHLSLPFCARLPLPDGVGNMKSLRTLEYFDLVRSSLEDIKGLGKLTNLRRLSLSRHNQGDGESVAPEAMHALFSSIQKLGNLKHLNLTNFTGIDDQCVSRLFPSRSVLLHDPGCMLPRVTGWSTNLHNLCLLSIAVDSICQDDLHLIGNLPSLASFDLSIAAPEEKIIITRCAGFPRLNRFEFTCDIVSYLIFETRAMPSLQALYLAFHVGSWDGTTPVGRGDATLADPSAMAPGSNTNFSN